MRGHVAVAALVLSALTGCRTGAQPVEGAPAPAAAPSAPAPGRGVQTGLVGPSYAPSYDLPRRAALRALAADADWAEMGRETAELLSQYLRINTTNPPGNEIEAARFLEAVLRREGIETQIFEPAPGKANLVARLPGDGSARPIVLLNHLDVVEASPEYWSVDPFGGVVRDGYVYGRGALDMKGLGMAELMAMIALKRAGVPLRRDVIFLATADEEVGGLSTLGAAWMAREHPEVLRNAEFLINEGGSNGVEDDGRLVYFGVGVTEKAPFWLSVTTRGTAGHGSRPTRDNPVERLIRALARIEAWDTPFIVTPAAERYFRDLSTREADQQQRAWLADVRAAVQTPAGRRFFESDLYHNAILRNTVSVTRVAGSGKVNVIPPVARAEVDIRLLPGQDPRRFMADLSRVVDDSLVTIEPMGTVWDATESPMDNELFRAVERVVQARYPGALVTTPMLSGFTDSHYFRRMGIASYGISPFLITEADIRGIHGNDERLSLSNITSGTRFMFEVLRGVAGR